MKRGVYMHQTVGSECYTTALYRGVMWRTPTRDNSTDMSRNVDGRLNMSRQHVHHVDYKPTIRP